MLINKELIDLTEEAHHNGGGPKLKVVWEKLNEQNIALESGQNLEDSSSMLSILKNSKGPVNSELLNNDLSEYGQCQNNDSIDTVNSPNQPLQESSIGLPTSLANSGNMNYLQNSEPGMGNLSLSSILVLDDEDYELEKPKMENSVNNGTAKESDKHSFTPSISQANYISPESPIILDSSHKDTNDEAMSDELMETEDRSNF